MKKHFTLLLLAFGLTLTIQAQVTNVANLQGELPIGTALHGSDLYVSALEGSRIVKIDLTQPFPATPTTLLSGISRPTGLTVIGDYLYFNTEGAIPGLPGARSARIDLTSQNPVIEQVLTNTIDDAQAYARIGDTLYISSANNGIFRINLSQPLPQAGVQITSENASGLALRGNQLYYGLYNGDKVSKINRHQPNPNPETVVSGLAGPDGLTFSGNFLYVSESTGSRIVKFDVTQPNPTVETVVDGLAGPTLTVFDGLSIYFSQQNNGQVSRLDINELSFSPPAPVCYTQPEAQRNGGSPLGGQYSGPYVTDNGDGATFTFDAQAAGPGSFPVTYTYGALTAQSSIEVTVEQMISTTSTDATCFGLNNGQITVSANEQVNYLWSNGATTATVTDLAPGTYNVTTTNAGGCMVTASASIASPSELQLLTSTQPSLGANDGIALVSVTGGTPPYSYLWSNGGTEAAITGIPAGTYTLTVSDANGCAQIAVATCDLRGDECATALDFAPLLNGGIDIPMVSIPVGNIGADASDDPAVDLATCFFQSDPLQHTVWYTFTGDGNRYRIRTVQGTATQYIQDGDTQAAVFTGDCTAPNFIGCLEDEDPNTGKFNIAFEINTVPGQHYLMLVDGYGGFQGEYCIEVTHLQSTSAIDISNTDISIAPNPTTGIVQWTDVAADEVQVFDVMGHLVQREVEPGTGIDLSYQPAGLYFLQIREKDNVYTARVVKE